jgi:nicotinic acid mononucleotide adenylyltransferase
MPKSLYLYGNFNPIHNGVLIQTLAVTEREGFGRVILVPRLAGKPELAPYEHRCDMLQAAVGYHGSPFAISKAAKEVAFASEMPVVLQTIVYWLERHENEGQKLNWLVGDEDVEDQVGQFPNLEHAVSLYVMPRAYAHTYWAIKSIRNAPQVACYCSDYPLVQTRGEDVRDRVWRGKDIRFHVPRGVAEYIGQHRLYLTKPGFCDCGAELVTGGEKYIGKCELCVPK